MTIAQAFALALQHHQAGRLAEAEALYRRIIAVQPNHAEALRLTGAIAHQVGRHDLAAEWIRRALVLDPNNPDSHCTLGEAFHATGRVDEAIAAYHRALELKPNFPEAWNNLGITLGERGQLDQAIVAFRRALELQPDRPNVLDNLGNALTQRGQFDEAVAACRRALEVQPDYWPASNNLGLALAAQGHLDGAIASYRRALELQPDSSLVHNNLGVALVGQRQFAEAATALRRAFQLEPDIPETLTNLGAALAAQGQFGEAIAAHRRALELQPDHLEALTNLGAALTGLNRTDEAIAAYRRVFAIKPDFADARQNLALALLLRGDLRKGWEEYEWRWKLREIAPLRRNFTQPLWDGGPLDGWTLLLHDEQGLGDAIQFIRYLPLAAQRGGSIVLECQQPLQRLFQTAAPDLPVVARGRPLPAFDVYCPLLSLPRIFSTDLGNIPGTAPYLRADSAGAALWRERLARPRSSLKVGLAWAGNPDHKNDRLRSLPLASLAPLADVPNVRFYSLQKGAAAAEAGAPTAGLELIDLTEDLRDFADTAALIANLDLVIAADTAVAHLAAAMGQPVWTLLPFAPDWRWLLDRSDSPWYPTMRLFRQPRLMDWAPVIADLRAQLQLLVQSREAKP